MSKAENLSKTAKEQMGLKILRWYWEGMIERPPITFDQFVEQVFWDIELKKGFRDEDLQDLGLQVAMYLLDNPFPNEARLKSNIEDLAKDTPSYMVPTFWALGQVIVDTSLNFEYINAARSSIIEAGTKFKEIATITTKAYFTYKTMMIAASALTAIILTLQVYKNKAKR